ncbi:helix-turn-helix domain-containing protein [Jatrophihabitans endophyticus]|nr:helix-turn-helix transcriptional regulator [Jatrophihabitans endophyticus]
MRVRDLAALTAYVRLLGVSQRRLAGDAGVGHATVNHLLSGRRRHCSAETAAAIERALGCPSGLFFEPVDPVEARVLATRRVTR